MDKKLPKESGQTKSSHEQRRQPYEAPRVLQVFQLEALAVVCTDTNAKNDVALGCNPGALFS